MLDRPAGVLADDRGDLTRALAGLAAAHARAGLADERAELQRALEHGLSELADGHRFAAAQDGVGIRQFKHPGAEARWFLSLLQ